MHILQALEVIRRLKENNMPIERTKMTLRIHYKSRGEVKQQFIRLHPSSQLNLVFNDDGIIDR